MVLLKLSGQVAGPGGNERCAYWKCTGTSVGYKQWKAECVVSEYEYDYILDKDDPKGVSVKSWLEKNKLVRVIIDV